jgi:hypothetical protein
MAQSGKCGIKNGAVKPRLSLNFDLRLVQNLAEEQFCALMLRIVEEFGW